MASSNRESACSHSSIYTDVPVYVRPQINYRRPSLQDRLAAASLSGSGLNSRIAKSPLASSFPGPVVTPGDSCDGGDSDTEDPDTLTDYVGHEYRNRVTPRRNTIYVVDAPRIGPGMEPMKQWLTPVSSGNDETSPAADPLDGRPKMADIGKYLEAFYHGMPVKVLNDYFKFAPWKSKKPKVGQPGEIGLSNPKGLCTRIRHRPSPDGVAAQQLNLEDLLDALLACLPSDAHSIVLLTHHDTYETEDDDFCCGRAYGGSRVCVVSSFRYNPVLDAAAGIARSHTWPASHCRVYTDGLWRQELGGTTRSKAESILKPAQESSTPMGAAVAAFRDATAPSVPFDGPGAWFARTCRTASHELGHCFCLDHCAYYACVMQTTFNMAEDERQPPYLCPVCLAKVAYTVAVEPASRATRGKDLDASSEVQEQWIADRYRALETFCHDWDSVGMFAAYRAWIRQMLEQQE